MRVGWNDSLTFLSRGLCRTDRDLAKRLAGWFLLCALTGKYTHYQNKDCTEKLSERAEESRGNFGMSEITNSTFSLCPHFAVSEDVKEISFTFRYVIPACLRMCFFFNNVCCLYLQQTDVSL